MNEEDVDGYIATFERLALVAGWHRDASGTVEFFRKGLTHSILRACLLRTTMPETMDEWQTAARAETQRARTLASCLPPRGPRKLLQTFYSHTAPTATSPQPVSDGAVPMDVDAISTTPRYNPRPTTPLNDADRAVCQREGRCFRCRQIGHRAALCPQRPNPAFPRIPAQVNAIAITPPAVSPVTQPVAQNAASAAMNHILGLNEQDQQAVINNLLLMGMGGFTPSIETPQINAISLTFAPSSDTSPPGITTQLDITPFATASPLAAARIVGAASSVEEPLPIPPPFLPDLASLSLTDSPPPRPPRSPRRPSSPAITPPPLPVVEDDNSPKGEVKTSSSASVFTAIIPINETSQHAAPTAPHKLIWPTPVLDESPPLTPSSRPARSPRRENRSIFISNAFERPRDPEEVAPQTPRLPVQHHRTNAADDAPSPQTANSDTTRPVATHDRDRQTHNPRCPQRDHGQNPEARRPRRTLWLQQIIHNPPPRPQYRPPPPLGNITEERADTDLELCEYRTIKDIVRDEQVKKGACVTITCHAIDSVLGFLALSLDSAVVYIEKHQPI
ncbi:hypothetical protein EDB86DRAFT_3242150 [Lactarius hatsudake]|nr:hypothetical protein EDB86DRAFT_3242150 [Lactarius hatsudake]